MKRIIAIFITIVLFLSTVCIESFAVGNSAETLYEEGMEFFEKEDYDRAFARFQIAGEVRGYAPAQNMLGVCYRDGLGIEADIAEAEKYFKLSADQGYVIAQENLTSLYTTVGNGLINGIPANGSGHVYMGGIKWRVLGKGSSSWLLISVDVLGGTMNWEIAKNYGNSQMSAWFSRVEQDAVLLTSKTESYDSGYYQSASGRMYSAADLNGESLFLLSAEEAETYFRGEDDRRPGRWWLRSPYYYDDSLAGVVYDVGSLYYYSVNGDGGFFGARPAFQLNLSSVLFTVAASGSKSTAASGGSDFGTLTGGDELKLTLIDSSSFSASVNGSNSASIPSDGRIEITHSEVTDGRQVSALLYVGDTVYYATHTPDGTGKWTVTLPSSLSPADTYTLKVFSEQLNEDYKTDYASTPAVITLNGRNMGVDTDPDDVEEEQQKTSDEEKETENDTQIDLSLISIGDHVTFGAYEQDNNLANGPEPVEWQVLDVQDNKALLLSIYALDSVPFENTKSTATWETSSLRAWLNQEFYDEAFSKEEKAYIQNSQISNVANPKYGAGAGADTNDAVFLLSIPEAQQYFKNDSERECQATKYLAQKAAGNRQSMARVFNDNTCWWSLRTSGSSLQNAAGVTSGGTIHNGGDSVQYANCIRPAIRVRSGHSQKDSKEAETPAVSSEPIPPVSTPDLSGRTVMIDNDRLTVSYTVQDLLVTVKGLEIEESYQTNKSDATSMSLEHKWGVEFSDSVHNYDVSTTSWAFAPGQNQFKSIDQMQHSLWIDNRAAGSFLKMKHTDNTITWQVDLTTMEQPIDFSEVMEFKVEVIIDRSYKVFEEYECSC